MEMLSPIQLTALAIAIVGAVIDWRTDKVPNLLTFPAALVGIAWNLVAGGWQASLWAVAGWFVGAALVVAPSFFLVRFLPSLFPNLAKSKKDPIGMGDAKLLAAVGAFVGPAAIIVIYLFFSIFFGAVTVTRGAMAVPWKEIIAAVMASQAGTKVDIPPEQVEKYNAVMRSGIPVGPVLALGTLVGMLLEKPTLKFLGFG